MESCIIKETIVCEHNYESYNGYWRCSECDDRIHTRKYVVYLQEQVVRLKQRAETFRGLALHFKERLKNER
jgi:hypothetical protein